MSPDDTGVDAVGFGDVRWLTPEEVRQIHEYVLQPGNLTGEDGARPIESSLARIEQRVHYGDLEPDVLAIGVAYACAIAKAHCFRDGNKRTALLSMETFLRANRYRLIGVDQNELADLMEAVAGDQADERAMYARLIPHIGVIEDGKRS